MRGAPSVHRPGTEPAPTDCRRPWHRAVNSGALTGRCRDPGLYKHVEIARHDPRDKTLGIPREGLVEPEMAGVPVVPRPRWVMRSSVAPGTAIRSGERVARMNGRSQGAAPSTGRGSAIRRRWFALCWDAPHDELRTRGDVSPGRGGWPLGQCPAMPCRQAIASNRRETSDGAAAFGLESAPESLRRRSNPAPRCTLRRCPGGRGGRHRGGSSSSAGISRPRLSRRRRPRPRSRASGRPWTGSDLR